MDLPNNVRHDRINSIVSLRSFLKDFVQAIENIDLSGYVVVDKQQSFTDAQKNTARNNIGASSLTDFQIAMSQLIELRTKDNFMTKNLGYTGTVMGTGEAKALEAETSGDASIAWVVFTYGDENSPSTAIIHQKHEETITVQTMYFGNRVVNRTITFTNNKRTSVESVTAWNTVTSLLGVQATQTNIVLRLMNSHLDGSQGLYSLTLPAVSTTQAGVITPSQFASLVNGGDYDSNSKSIRLKHDNTVLASIDATAFIKDGMISNVTIRNGQLVILFNTDAGKEDIRIPLTEIFNPDNYYTKTEINNLIENNDKVYVDDTVAIQYLPEGEIVGEVKEALVAFRAKSANGKSLVVFKNDTETGIVATVASWGSSFEMWFFYNGKFCRVTADASDEFWKAHWVDLENNSSVKEMINITYASLKNLRDNSLLKPGQFYRITDYVTTTIQKDTRSAGHAFDIIVRADSANSLNEQASAIQHQGDTYFDNTNMEAWELKYKLDNVLWSKRICTIISDANDGFQFESIGTVSIEGQTYILWDASEAEDDYRVNRVVSLTKEPGAEMWEYNSQTGTIVENGYNTSIKEVVGEWDEDGKGTIVYMKDEWGNIAGYDFKNIQQKRWRVTEIHGVFNNKYLGVLNHLPTKLSIKNESDFIWAYLYSVYNYSGGTQDTTDHSLSGRVHDMDTNFTVNDNNAFVWGSISGMAYDCKFLGNVWCNSFSGNMWGNSFSGNIEDNSFSGYLRRNLFYNYLENNSFSGNVQNNSFLGRLNHNSFSGDVQNNSFSSYLENNSFSGDVQNNTFFKEVKRDSFSGYVHGNSFSGDVKTCSFLGSMQNSTFPNVQNSIFSGDVYQTSFSGNINCLYTLGKINGKTITVPTDAAYPTYAAMTTAGQLKIWNPAG